ncbi:MAG: RHS repeat-associated core domain-containing protein [Thermodesulfobacteriota bacterium]
MDCFATLAMTLVLGYYDANRLSHILTPEASIDYTYLCTGRVGSVTNGVDGIAYGYDGSLLTSDSRSGTLNQVLRYVYNNDFVATSFTYAGTTVNYTYDADGLLTTAGNFAIGRDAANGLPLTVSGGAYAESRGFKGYGEPKSQTIQVGGQQISDWNLTHDDAGRIVQRNETVAGTAATRQYEYDAAGRLLKVFSDGVPTEEYRYGANNARTYEMNTGRGIAGRTYAYSVEDHLLSAGSATYQFDVDGFLASKTEGAATTTYTYSSRGDLVRVGLPDGRVVEYVYDPLQRRVAKKIDTVVVEKYLWQDMTTLLAVYDGSDHLLMRFEYADGRLPVAMTMAGVTYYLAYGPTGTLRLVTDAAGNVVKRIDTDAFGNVISDSNPALALPFGFAGGLADRDTGLVHFGYRDYDPEIGRWIAKDPILFAGGDTDLYGYVQNNPINFIDPLGLYWFRQDWQPPGVVGRDRTIVPPQGNISEVIEQYVPAGYTFGEMHDSFVGMATSAGLPDWLVNIPSMPSVYNLAVTVELLRSLGILEQPSLPEQATPCEGHGASGSW